MGEKKNKCGVKVHTGVNYGGRETRCLLVIVYCHSTTKSVPPHVCKLSGYNCYDRALNGAALLFYAAMS